MLSAKARGIVDFSSGLRSWSVNLGIARTLLALSAVGTLSFSSVATLTQPGVGIASPFCGGASGISTWCLAPSSAYDFVRLGQVAILLIAASGWRPRITALPMWWILFSNQASLTTVDGGDQIAAVLSLLLLPVSLTDPRRWHWQRLQSRPGKVPSGAVIAGVTVGVLQAQVAFVYIDACLTKLSVPEWADGTAGYYWLRDPVFGPAGSLRSVVDALMLQPLLVVGMTWGSLALEFMLGIAIFLPTKAKRALLPAGILFHLSIALTMGLWSFALTMWAGLVIYLWPKGEMPRIVVGYLAFCRARMRAWRREEVSGSRPVDRLPRHQ